MLWPLKFFYSPKDTQSQYFRDALGRIVIYHGTNLSNHAKHSSPTPGYYGMGRADISWHTQDDIKRLNTWGFNLVRYLVFWEALEPEKGRYNEDYLTRTRERIRWLRDNNIDVIIDFHQDLYTQKFLGDGFPEWATYDEGKPFEKQEPWNKGYFQPAVKAAYKNFWHSTPLQNAYIAAVSRVVTEVSNFNNVIGIDVMNEPIPILPRFLSFESGILSDFYDKIYPVIQRYNPRLKMIFEPWMSTSTGIPSNLSFKPRMNCVYAPHYYDYWCETNEPYKPFNKWWMRRAIEIKVREAQKYKVPILIGEFGFPPAAPGYLEGMQDFLDLVDEYGVSWTHWSYDRTDHNDRGILNPDLTGNDLLKKLVRIYPQRIAGDNPTYKLTKDTFTLTYEKSSASGSTEIFIPDGVLVTVEQSTGKCVYDTVGRRVSMTNSLSRIQSVTLKYTSSV